MKGRSTSLSSRGIIFLFPLIALPAIGSCFGFLPEVRVDSHTGGTTGLPDMICTNAGEIFAVWDGSDSGSPEHVWASQSADNGATWSLQRSVTDPSSTAGQFAPRAACDSQGSIYVAWEDYRGPEPWAAYFSSSSDGGQTWLWPNIRISDSGIRASEPSIAANADGSNLVAVFYRWPEQRIYSSRSVDGGLTWSPSISVSDPTGAGTYYPVVIWICADTFLAAWGDLRSEDCHIFCSITSDAGLTWQHPNMPIPDQGMGFIQLSLKLFAWQGVVHASWISPVNETDYVFYSRSEDLGSSWLEQAARVDTGNVALQRQFGGIWADGNDTLFVGWVEFEGGYPSYAVVSRSVDAGISWESPVTANPVSAEAMRCEIVGNQETHDIYCCWANGLNKHICFSRGTEDQGIDEEAAVRITIPFPFHVSPNPASGQVQIDVPDGMEGQIRVIDVAGRVVATLEADGSGSPQPWDASGMPAGIYTILFDSSEWSSTARVVVIH